MNSTRSAQTRNWSSVFGGLSPCPPAAVPEFCGELLSGNAIVEEERKKSGWHAYKNEHSLTHTSTHSLTHTSILVITHCGTHVLQGIPSRIPKQILLSIPLLQTRHGTCNDAHCSTHFYTHLHAHRNILCNTHYGRRRRKKFPVPKKGHFSHCYIGRYG